MKRNSEPFRPFQIIKAQTFSVVHQNSTRSQDPLYRNKIFTTIYAPSRKNMQIIPPFSSFQSYFDEENREKLRSFSKLNEMQSQRSRKSSYNSQDGSGKNRFFQKIKTYPHHIFKIENPSHQPNYVPKEPHNFKSHKTKKNSGIDSDGDFEMGIWEIEPDSEIKPNLLKEKQNLTENLNKLSPKERRAELIKVSDAYQQRNVYKSIIRHMCSFVKKNLTKLESELIKEGYVSERILGAYNEIENWNRQERAKGRPKHSQKIILSIIEKRDIMGSILKKTLSNMMRNFTKGKHGKISKTNLYVYWKVCHEYYSKLCRESTPQHTLSPSLNQTTTQNHSNSSTTPPNTSTNTNTHPNTNTSINLIPEDRRIEDTVITRTLSIQENEDSNMTHSYMKD